MKISMKPGKILSKLWAQYSAPAVFCVVIAIVASTHDFLGWDTAVKTIRDTLMDASSALLFGLVISTTVCTLLKSCKPTIVLSWLAGFASATLEYFLPAPNLYGGIAMAAVCLCLWGAAGREKPALRLNQICGWFFLSLGMAFVIWVALEIIQSAILVLFFPGAPSTIISGVSSAVGYFSFLVFAPWMFLGGLPDESTPDNKRLGFWKFNTRVLLPLALLLMAVLLAYVGKIVVTCTMPVGTMNGYALAALALFTFFHLTLTGEENKLTAFFRKWAGWLMLPILIAQQVGVWIRVDAYGLTEARIYGIVCTVLCAAVVVTALLRKRAGWFFPVAAIAAIIFISTPLNAGNLARINQETRLEAALARNNMLAEDGSIIPNADADLDDRTIIYDSISYLLNKDAPEGSRTDWLTRRYTPENSTYAHASATELYELLGFTRPQKAGSNHALYYHFIGSANHYELDTADVAHANWLSTNRRYDSSEDFAKALVEDLSLETSYFITDYDAMREALLAPAKEFTFPDIPLTLVINGEEILLNPLLNGLEVTDIYPTSSRDFRIENDRIPLANGQVFHIAELNCSVYSAYSSLYISISGWLLTPEAE
jgi:hypothetical protein